MNDNVTNVIRLCDHQSQKERARLLCMRMEDYIKKSIETQWRIYHRQVMWRNVAIASFALWWVSALAVLAVMLVGAL